VRRYPLERPDSFELNTDNQLAQGLVFAGLGRIAGSTHYRDSSLYGNHGTLTNMDPATDWVWDNFLGRWVTKYDGSNDEVIMSGVAVTSEPYTLSAWFSTDTYKANLHPILALINSDWGNFTGIGASRKWVVDAYQYRFGLVKNFGATAQIISTTNFSLNRWYHVCGVFDSTTSRSLYVDGALQGSDTATATNPSLPPRLGRDDDAASALLGNVGDPLIHSRALSAAEIQQLAAPSNTMLSGLILPPKRKIWAAVTGEAPAAGSRRRRLLCGAA
jgi:hypothetical protein